jgi:hypothetical protein
MGHGRYAPHAKVWAESRHHERPHVSSHLQCMWEGTPTRRHGGCRLQQTPTLSPRDDHLSPTGEQERLPRRVAALRGRMRRASTGRESHVWRCAMHHYEPRCVAPFAARCVVYAPICRGMHEESRTYGHPTCPHRRRFADLRPWHHACIIPPSRCRHAKPGEAPAPTTYAVPRQGRGPLGSLKKRPT